MMNKVINMTVIDDDSRLDGTSFHNNTVKATVNQLTEILGEPSYACEDEDEKVQYEWDCECETEDGDPFYVSVYDWKEYREYSEYETIEWHIGGKSSWDTDDARDYIESKLKEL
jgi:hypothetical protein